MTEQNDDFEKRWKEAEDEILNSADRDYYTIVSELVAAARSLCALLRLGHKADHELVYAATLRVESLVRELDMEDDDDQ